MRVVGRARDAVTPRAGGRPHLCAEDSFVARVGWDRTILEIDASPARRGVADLVGARGGGQLRAAVDAALPAEKAAATPLHLLLDDLAGASLVAGWAWSRWRDDWREAAIASGARQALRNMENICTGFRTGSTALADRGVFSLEQSACEVIDLRHPDDPEGWHAFMPQSDVAMRRARRIDIWEEGGLLHVDSAFQDSATTPAGGRQAVHEYRLTAVADPVSLQLLAIEADPRVLPYAECPGAAANAGRLVGERLPAFRTRVLRVLQGAAGCTHLNDALRALAEAPQLSARLQGVLASGVGDRKEPQ